ncbi:Transposon Tf2-1 polyprotein [Penicillium brevicompactum]
MAFFRHQSTLRSTRGLMLRLAQAAEITDTTQQLRIVWMRIDPSLQRDVAEPNAGTSVATFMQQLDQRYEWNQTATFLLNKEKWMAERANLEAERANLEAEKTLPINEVNSSTRLITITRRLVGRTAKKTVESQKEDPRSQSLITEAHRDEQPSANPYPDPIYGEFATEEGGPGFWAKWAQKAPWRRCFGPSHDEKVKYTA